MISMTSEYALRALVCLADSAGTERIVGRDLAQRTQVPSNYLSKVMLLLRHAGIVQATRGARGGYYLLKAPNEIRLLEVVELIEGPRTHPACLLGHKPLCSAEDPCSAHPVWSEVRRAYLHFLESTSVADIAPSYKLQVQPEAPAHAPVEDASCEL